MPHQQSRNDRYFADCVHRLFPARQEGFVALHHRLSGLEEEREGRRGAGVDAMQVRKGEGERGMLELDRRDQSVQGLKVVKREGQVRVERVFRCT